MFSSRKQSYFSLICLTIIFSTLSLLIVGSERLSYSQVQQGNANNTLFIQNISDNIRDSVYPQTESSENNVYVVWQDNLFGHNRQNYDILLKTSTDGGQTFGDVINLSDNAGKTSFPKISSSQENVYVAWNIDSGDKSIVGANTTEGEIFFVKSTDNGSRFDKENRLNTDENPGEVQIDALDNDVYIVWGSPDPSTVYQDTALTTNENINSNLTGDGIYFTKSIDDGNSFAKPSFIQGQFLNPLNVEIIQYSGELIVAIQAMPLNNTMEGNQDIFLMRSQDMGDSFSESVNISNNSGISECPSMTVSSDNKLFVVWQDKSLGNNEALSTKTNL